MTEREYKLHLMSLGATPRTLAERMRNYRAFDKWCKDTMLWPEPKEIKELNISQIREYLLMRKYNLSAFYGVKSIYRWLFLDDYIDENPCDRLEDPKRKISMPDYLSLDEIEYLFNIADTRERTMLHLLFATGMRIGELVVVAESDLMLNNEMIKIHGKGGKERYGLLYREAVTHLEKWVMIRRRARLKSFWGGHAKSLLSVFKKKIPDEDLRIKFHPHIMRHSFATHMIRGGADIMVVKQLLGHESIKNTEKYIHISGQQIRQAVNIFAEARKKLPVTKNRPLSRAEIKEMRSKIK